MFDYTEAQKLLESSRDFPACLSYYETMTGGLSKPSKMPWYGWSIPAANCITGSKLRLIENSVCASCYACKGRYSFKNVQDALERRLAIYRANPERWAVSMVMLLDGKSKGEPKDFRWFDSGDLQSRKMIEAIVWIAKQLPKIKFWLPSKEGGMLVNSRTLRLVKEAPNLTVRISAPMVGEYNPNSEYPTSTVGYYQGIQCPAQHNKGKCGDCRACWDKRVENINYPKH